MPLTMIRWSTRVSKLPWKNEPHTYLRSSFQLSSVSKTAVSPIHATPMSNMLLVSPRFLTLSRSLPSHAKATVPPRRTVSPVERTELRSARKKQADATLRQAQQKESVSQTSTATTNSPDFNTAANSTTVLVSSKKPWDSRIVYGFGVGIPTILLSWAIYDDQSPPAQLARTIGITSLIDDIVEDFAKPSRPKLLPDWSQMPNVPHDMTPPHTLVLDLENTLVHSTWDRKHGWRHAKRPGVDKFLTDMAQYYEIVLYSPSHEGLADPVVASLDKNGCIMHRLYRDACYYKNGSYTKDLSSLNRNMNKIILIDDDESAARSHKENWIPIRPYDNPNDRTDSTLSRITPFLIEVAREGYNDIPGLLRQFRGMDADGIADEMERRVREMRDLREKRSLHGLGALVHVGRGGLPPPEMTPVDASSVSSSVKQLTSKDLVAGAVTGTSSDSGGFKGWLNKRQKEKEEQHMRTMEHWNEIMMKKSMEKKEREASTTV